MVGLQGGEWFGPAAGRALAEAEVLVGSERHLAALPAALPGERVGLGGGLHEALETAAAEAAAGRRVCLLASGDPGFFGVVRLAAARLGRGRLRIYPAPSSVSLAFARVGVAWDDAAVVSAHGRPVERVLATVVEHPKVAVLGSPEHPPEALGRALVDRGCPRREVVVASRLGERGEALWGGELAGLAVGRFDPLSVVLFLAPRPVAPAGLAWGLADELFSHRGGMITKAEVRAVALGKLALPDAGVLWDVGAGCGSVAAECARLAPGLAVYAVERDPGDAARARANAAGAGVTVVQGEAPAALAGLPDPHRAFVGGGGVSVLDAVLARLRPDGRVVATYASVDRAAAAASRLGNLVQVSVSRGRPAGSGGWRLAAENPVFVCWGPCP